MSSSALFQSKLVSIMEILVNSAVADICRLVDDGAAVLHFEISRSKSENEDLRLKLQLLERELQTVRRGKKTLNSVGIQCADPSERHELSTMIKQEQHSSSLQEEKERTATSLPQVIHGQLECQHLAKDWTLSEQSARTDKSCDRALPNEPSLNHHQELTTRHHRNTNRTQVNSHQPGRTAEGQYEIGESNIGHRSRTNSRLQSRSEATHREESSLPLKSENKLSCEQDSKYDQTHQELQQQHQQQLPFFSSEPYSNLKDKTGLLSDVCEVEYELNDEDCCQDDQDSVNSRHQMRPKQEADGEGSSSEQVVHAPVPLDISPQCLYQAASQLTFALQEVTGGGPAAGVEPSGPTAARPHVCPQCGRGFAHTHVLKRHLVVHSGLRPYPCGYCGKRFSLRDSLRRHQRIHTGERPYGCQLCGKRFTQRTHLNIHLSVHTGIRPFTCTHCGRSFTQTHVLRRHMRVHAAEGLSFYQENS
ncbi:hypothetical protein ACEWY4_027247 [Coilia grayii]|uniref:C2H2-type domain-containing protein n=1 Tax=Coilia grayii TaxID=363190 RepID=A0ABD1IRX0_9TELE